MLDKMNVSCQSTILAASPRQSLHRATASGIQPTLQEIERLGVAELGKAAKISLAEGDLDEAREDVMPVTQ